MMVSCGGELRDFFFQVSHWVVEVGGKAARPEVNYLVPTTTGIQDGPSGMLYKL